MERPLLFKVIKIFIRLNLNKAYEIFNIITPAMVKRNTQSNNVIANGV